MPTVHARSIVAGLLFATLMVVSTPADAQEPTRRPFRRIFGTTPERPGGTHRLDINFMGVGAYDDNVFAEELPEGDPRFQESGFFPSGTVDLHYTLTSGRARLNVHGATALQYFPQLEGGSGIDRSHSGSADFSAPLGPRATFRAAQTVSFADFFTLNGLPGSVIPDPALATPGNALLDPTEAYAVAEDGGWQYHTLVGVTRSIRRSGSIDARYGFSRTDFTSLESNFHDTGLSYSHTLSRSLSLVAGYGYQRGRGTTGETVAFHDVDLGLSYRRALPGLRNTTVDISTGSAITGTAEEREYQLTADARLVHLMGRSWSASAAYRRGVEFLSALGEVVSSDAGTFTLNGFINPALETWVTGRFSQGHLGSRHGPPLKTYSAVARVQYALSRTVAMDAQYLLYSHEFGADATVPEPVTPSVRRQGVRVGVIWFWAVIR
jgi:hypothetical protein